MTMSRETFWRALPLFAIALLTVILSIGVPLFGMLMALFLVAFAAVEFLRARKPAPHATTLSRRAETEPCETPDNCVFMRAHTGRPYCAACQRWLA